MADELDDLLDGQEEEKKSNKLVIILVTILIVLIWLAIFVLLVSWMWVDLEARYYILF